MENMNEELINDEEYDPEITINRALEAYRRKGYSDDWINQRLKAIDARKSYEKEIKKSAISKDNFLNYQYIDEIEKIENK